MCTPSGVGPARPVGREHGLGLGRHDPASSQPASPAITKPTPLSTPCVLAMSRTLNAGTSTYWASAHCTASSMGTSGDSDEITRRMRPTHWARPRSDDGTTRACEFDVASRKVPKPTAQAATVTTTAPPTCARADSVTNPVATIGGPAMLAMLPIDSATRLAIQSAHARPVAASSAMPNPA